MLEHSRIKAMSSAVSSCSDEEGESSAPRSQDPSSSSVDTDADESDHRPNGNGIKPVNKSRRFQKTRKTSFSSNVNNHTPPISRTNIRKDEQHHQRWSSNDEDRVDVGGANDEIVLNYRRARVFALKKRDHMTTTTTTDDDTTKRHPYRPLMNLEKNDTVAPTKWVPANPPPTNPAGVRKASRFQVKSIRKSQQQHILLANAAAAKSSNDDDACSASQQRTRASLKQSLIERAHANTPTTDGEHSTTNTDQVVNGAVLALKTVKDSSSSNGNGHHRVRFQEAPPKKHESPAEEEKTPVPVTPAPAPAPPSSAASAQGEVSSAMVRVRSERSRTFVRLGRRGGRSGSQESGPSIHQVRERDRTGCVQNGLPRFGHGDKRGCRLVRATGKRATAEHR